MNDVNLIFSHCSLMHVMLKRTRWQINQGEYTEQLTIQYRQEIWYAICYLFVCLLCNTKTSELYACKAPKFWGCTRRHNIHFSLWIDGILSRALPRFSSSFYLKFSFHVSCCFAQAMNKSAYTSLPPMCFINYHKCLIFHFWSVHKKIIWWLNHDPDITWTMNPSICKKKKWKSVIGRYHTLFPVWWHNRGFKWNRFGRL